MNEFFGDKIEKNSSEVLPKDSEIEALVPLYTPRGDETVVYLQDGREIILHAIVRTVLKKLSMRRCKDLKLIRKFSSSYTARRLNNPLAIGPEMVLVPFKVRLPRVKGDRVMACVNVFAVLGVFESEDGLAHIRLNSGRTLASLWDALTLKRYLQEAELIKEKMLLEVHGIFFRHLEERRRDFFL